MRDTENQSTLQSVVILTAIKEEYQAVRCHLHHPQHDPKNDTSYETGIFSFQGKDIARVTIRECGATNVNASQETERAIQNFKPDCILFVGIAGSRKPHDFGIGDVIFPKKIYSYEGGKSGGTVFQARPDQGSCTHALLELAKRERNIDDWKRCIASDWKERAHDVKADLGVIASGEKLIEHYDSETGALLTRYYNDTHAVEMEGFGFAKAAMQQGRETNSILIGVVRGISDIIQQQSTEHNENSNTVDRRPANNKQFASATAAAFAYHLIAKLYPASEDFKNIQTDIENRISTAIAQILSDDTNNKLREELVKRLKCGVNTTPKTIAEKIINKGENKDRLMHVFNMLQMMLEIVKSNQSCIKATGDLMNYVIQLAIDLDLFRELYTKYDKIKTAETDDSVYIQVAAKHKYDPFVYEILIAAALERPVYLKYSGKKEEYPNTPYCISTVESGLNTTRELDDDLYFRLTGEKRPDSKTTLDVVALLANKLADGFSYFTIVPDNIQAKALQYPYLTQFVEPGEKKPEDGYNSMPLQRRKQIGLLIDKILAEYENGIPHDDISGTMKEKITVRKELNLGTNVLFLGAHCDDIEIGCGGTVARCVAEGKRVRFGIATDCGDTRKQEAVDAIKTLGLSEGTDIKFNIIPDGRLEQHKEIISGWLRDLTDGFFPDTIFVHVENDTHPDHRILFETARMFFKTGCTMYLYHIDKLAGEQVPFEPDLYIDISDYIDAKISLCKCHVSQSDKPVYLDGEKIKNNARDVFIRITGKKSGYAEAFKTLKHEIM